MNWWTLGPLLFATTAWLTFIVWYWLRAKWWKNILGVNMMTCSIILLLILIRLDTLQIWPDLKPSTVWGFVLYTGAGVVAIQRTYLMEKAQRRAAHNTKNRRWDDPK